MFFQQFKVKGLGCYSYLVGCPRAGVAFVVDPERHVQQYVDTAYDNSMRITHIFDTHLHADHITGTLELAAKTGAAIHVHPAIAPHYPNLPVRDGDQFKFGSVVADILETPGHTPNSISLVVTDTKRSDAPQLIMTGDLLFVGDVGRPDLAGEDLLEEQIRNLYNSLYQKLGQLPDWVELYPAHGEGSLCGKSMSSKSNSTLGYERKNNPLLNQMSFDDFHTIMTAEFQLRPPGFVNMVHTNQRGPGLLADRPPLRKLSVDDVETRMNQGVVLVDVRPATAFGAAFIQGSINIGLTPNSAMWLGMVLPQDTEIIVVSDNYTDALEAQKQFLRTGYDRITGCLDSGVQLWAIMGKPLNHLPQLSVDSLKHVLKKYPDHVLLDVRTDQECRGGCLPRSIHKPLSDLVTTGLDLDKTTHITTLCGTGYRSNIAGSYLKSEGFHHIFVLVGGLAAWNRHTQASI